MNTASKKQEDTIP